MPDVILRHDHNHILSQIELFLVDEVSAVDQMLAVAASEQE